MTNLFNFEKIRSVNNESITTLLKEQQEVFNDEFDGLLYINIVESTEYNYFTEPEGYSLKTIVSVVSPSLNNYKYRLFTVYSNITPLFPVGLSVNWNSTKDSVVTINDFECENYNDFKKDLANVLADSRIIEVLQALYLKSK